METGSVCLEMRKRLPQRGQTATATTTWTGLGFGTLGTELARRTLQASRDRRVHLQSRKTFATTAASDDRRDVIGAIGPR
jgi:hypothetical protein